MSIQSSSSPRITRNESINSGTSLQSSGWEPGWERTRTSSEVVDHVPGNWQEDTKVCGLCTVSIGKLSRHHCRICGLCVCAACSPSGFQVHGSDKQQRACAACVANAVRVPAVMQRLGLFSSKLFALCDERAPSRDAPPTTRNLVEAATRCEAALSPLEVSIVENRRRAERAEADLAVAGELAHQLQQRLAVQSSSPSAADHSTPKREMPTPKSSNRSQRRSCSPTAQTWSAAQSSSAGQTVYSPTLGHNTSQLSGGGKSSTVQGDLQDDFLCSSKTVIGKAWEDNTTNCSICDAKFGWHVFKRWHHCRICGRCVCSKCSPSSLCLESGEKPVRVCTPCVTDAPQVCALANRVGELSARVGAFFGQDVSEQALRSEDLRVMLSHCETILEPIEKMNGKIGPPAADGLSQSLQSSVLEVSKSTSVIG